MNPLNELGKKATKWKQISEELQTIFDLLASKQESREEWYYKMQVKMLLSKAKQFSNEYADKLKQLEDQQPLA